MKINDVDQIRIFIYGVTERIYGLCAFFMGKIGEILYFHVNPKRWYLSLPPPH